MSKITQLEKLVRDFYESHRDTWIPYWTEYLYDHHIFIVAEEAKKLSEELQVNGELAIAASLLHDIADAILPRVHPDHAVESQRIAQDLLAKAEFTELQSEIIVYEIIGKHNCRNGVKPESIDGRIMTNADAIGHLATDFYDFAITRKKSEGFSNESIKAWGLEKVDREFFVKMYSDKLRERYKDDYERCKSTFLAL